MIPKLRFPEFKDNYTKEALGSVSRDISYGIGAAAKPYDFEYRYLRITDIDETSFTNLTYENSVSPNCTQREANEYILSKGDLVLARTGASVGKIFLNTRYDNLVYAGFLIRFKINNKALPYYIASSLQTQRYHQWVSVMSVRSGQPGINAKEYSQYPLNLPSLQEQKRVSDLFNSLDRKINLLTNKKQALETYKKGLIQKIFSQQLSFKREDGTDYPEWVFERLKEVCIKENSGLSKGDLSDVGLNEVYGAAGEIEGYTNIPSPSSAYVSIIKDGAGVGRVKFLQPNTSTIGTLDMIVANDSLITPYFLYILLSTIRWRKYTVGSTIPHIYFRDWKTEKVQIPSLEEQRKIVKVFSDLESKRSKILQMIEKTEMLKKGLLQQMFI